jgi:3-phenylpropionate/cinnamic acid dioxygenase small subunit
MLHARASFMVARIMHTGETVLFATGTYRDRIALDGETARFAERAVILDSRQIDTLLAIPL